MADKTLEPPIKDTDKDGVLTSKEILAQLRAEEEQGRKRTPNEKVHGVLEMVMRDSEGRSLPAEHAELLLIASIFDPNEIKNVKKATADKLEHLFKKYNGLANNPDLDGAIARFRNAIDSAPAEDEAKKVERADLDNLEKYLKTTKQTFPNGVKIDPNDVTEIMGHFSPQPLVVIPEKESQQQQTTSSGREM